MVQETHGQQGAAQARDGGARQAELGRELAVGVRARVAHEGLQDEQALGQGAGDVRVFVPHPAQVVGMFHGLAAILDRAGHGSELQFQ
ncbi:hypothetical protein D9M72_617000 [compost metagenome]